LRPIVRGKVGSNAGSLDGSDGDRAATSPVVGKQTLIEHLPEFPSVPMAAGVPRLQLRDVPPGGSAAQHGAAVQRVPVAAGADDSDEVAAPKGGIDKVGFIDQSDGANLRTGPAESGGKLVWDPPLPPATRVFVSGTHPDAPAWWYVTAYLGKAMVRGYVQGFRVNTELPEPLAELHQVEDGDTAERLARQKFTDAVTDGHDLRYYENVLLHVNQQRGRAGVTGTYQDPGVLGGGSNNVQLLAGHRIWLVSAAYAKALQGVVPSGSLTGGAVAKVKRFVGHIEDILRSVTEARHHLGEVAGDYAQAIRDHLPEIAGIVAGFLMAEATSALLAATPTGVGQIAAVVIQLVLAAFGAAGMVQAGIAAVKHAIEWLTLAWTAKGKDEKIAAASQQFLKMLVSIAIAALSHAGAKGNHGNALTIASSMPTGGLPALAVAAGGQVGGAGAGIGVLFGPSTGSLGAAGNAMMQADKDGAGSTTSEHTGPELPSGLDKRFTKVIEDVLKRARKGKLLKAGNYHPHFEDATVLKIIKDADAIYQSEGKAGRLIFRKGTDIVVVEGPGTGQGNVVTGYGPSGIKGDSGAAALGGAAGDGGAPVTHAMLTEGHIPVPKGRPSIPKAVQIAP
jgi:hypothetical protein